MSLLESIKQDSKIDPDSLDVAWLEQANLYYKYSEAYNLALYTKNELKIEIDKYEDYLKELKSELDLEIRKNPEFYGLNAKVTEGAITATILTSSEYKEAVHNLYKLKKEFNEKQNEANKIYSCISSMEQRKTALENLVKLLNQQYFSTPQEPRNLSDEYYKKIQLKKQGAKEKIRNRRKNK